MTAPAIAALVRLSILAGAVLMCCLAATGTAAGNQSSEGVFGNTQKSADGPACSQAVRDRNGQSFPGREPYTATPQSDSLFSVTSSGSASSAPLIGSLTVLDRRMEVSATDPSPPGWAGQGRNTVGAFNESFTDFVGESTLSLTAPDGRTCMITFSVAATFTPSIVPLPQPAATAIPAADSCVPRPPVGVAVTALGDGVLEVTVTAGKDALTALQVGDGPNWIVEPQAPLQVPAGATSLTFHVRRTGPGAVAVPFTVIDGCGAWPTFVGGGAGAF